MKKTSAIVALLALAASAVTFACQDHYRHGSRGFVAQFASWTAEKFWAENQRTLGAY
jgi:hypothetical protein